jgi:hypothetical protein
MTLTACLRTGRVLRIPRARTRGRGKTFISPAVMISQRPAEAVDRAVPGHWEGDLIVGLGSSAIGTLVERKTRFTLLLHLPLCAMCGRPLGCKRKSEKSDGCVDCDHVSGLFDAAPCPLAQMGSAIHSQAMIRLRKPRHRTGSSDRRFDRSSSHSALSPRHQRAVPADFGGCR